jgi:hypothetical protein
LVLCVLSLASSATAQCLPQAPCTSCTMLSTVADPSDCTRYFTCSMGKVYAPRVCSSGIYSAQLSTCVSGDPRTCVAQDYNAGGDGRGGGGVPVPSPTKAPAPPAKTTTTTTTTTTAPTPESRAWYGYNDYYYGNNRWPNLVTQAPVTTTSTAPPFINNDPLGINSGKDITWILLRLTLLIPLIAET